jgi:hypothetical protein
MNNTSLLFFLFFLSALLPASAQEYQEQPEYKNFPCPESRTGCYDSFKSFHTGIPAMISGFHPEKKNNHEIRESQAGGYSLKFDSAVPGNIRNADHVWGVYFDDTLYINRKFYIGKKGFDKVFCMGSYGYFHGINPNTEPISENAIYSSTMLFGLAGGLIADAADSERNRLYGKFPRVMIYLLDYETGIVSPLTSFKLEKILETDPELLQKYQKEKYRFSMMVLHAYIDTFAERHRNDADKR